MKNIIFFVCLLFIIESFSLSVIQSRYSVPKQWNKSTVDKDLQISFKFVMNQCNIDALEQKFNEVSDPTHPNYAKYLTIEELNDFVRCEGAEEKLMNYLNRFSNIGTEISGHVIKVTCDIATAESILNTQFFEFEHQISRIKYIRQLGDVSVDDEVASVINFVLGVSEFFHNTKLSVASHSASPAMYNPNAYTFSDPYVTPKLLRTLYEVPEDENCTASNNLLGIGAFDNDYSEFALCRFQGVFNDYSDPPVVSNIGPQVGSDQVESDLDVQYSTIMAKGIDTVFANHPPGEWILDWALATVQNTSTNGPWVWSLSYGWPEIWQCSAPDNQTITNCPTGYDYNDYINATNIELIKLGNLGVSVSVSSGDDGTVGFASNCPVDATQPINYGNGSTLCTDVMPDCQCAQVLINVIDNGNTLSCNLPVGILRPSACDTIFNGPYANLAGQAYETFASQNQFGNNYCKISYSTDLNYPFFASNCTCPDLTIYSITQGGVTVEVMGFEYRKMNGPAFLPNFPGASPYITSVGATAIQYSFDKCSSKKLVNSPEIYAQGNDASGFSGGGGFSSVSSAPAYQAQFIENYLQIAPQLPPASTFNGNARGYPDISLNGHNYLVSVGVTAMYENIPVQGMNGAVMPISGTSASSPSFAGMVALLNDHLLRNNLPTLGFLNPMLYQLATTKPESFNDIVPQDIMGPNGMNMTIGDYSGCTQIYCCQFGFSVTKGWDPATGLGTPRYSYLLQNIAAIWKSRGVTMEF